MNINIKNIWRRAKLKKRAVFFNIVFWPTLFVFYHFQSDQQTLESTQPVNTATKIKAHQSSLIDLPNITAVENPLTKSTEMPARVFTPWQYDFPCYADTNNKNKKGKNLKGLIFVKSRKCASTTLAGISLRIAYKHSTEKGKHCALTYHHMRARETKVSQREKDKAFLWTFVRDPTSQFLSQFFHFQVSRRHVKPTYSKFFKYVKNEYEDKYRYPQLSVINHKLTGMGKLKKKPAKIVQNILNEYDFIGLVERLDESLVILRLLLGLGAGDILYLSSKTHGNYDDGLFRNRCVLIQPTNTTPETDKYLASYEWKNKNNAVTMMHEAVNRSIDLTIQSIGQSKFEKALSEHRYLQSLVQKICSPTAIYPCSADGVFQPKLSETNCYESDFGCGYPCIDELYDNITKKGITY